MRIVSTFTLLEREERYTIIAHADTMAKDAYITSYKYDEIHSQFCGINSNNSSNNNTTTAPSNNDDDQLTDNACPDLLQIQFWLKMARIFYIISMIIIIFTAIIWILLIQKYELNTKLLLKILLISCYISLILSVFTLILLLVAYYYIVPRVVVDAIIILTNFEQDRLTFGPTILMLIVNILVTCVTIYSAFYSRTPGFTFVQWNKSHREDSDHSIDV